MRDLKSLEPAPKRAFVIGVRDDKLKSAEAESLAKELASLADTLGLEIAGKETVNIRKGSARYGMGTGKAAEIAEKAAAVKADCLIFDGELKPSQQRNWETLTNLSAIDRQELIIQIFASRARTREAELQVEVARLIYSLPRLTHKYIDLSRQRGGRYGTKGSGETKLETDRRLVEDRIHRLRDELAELRKQRGVQRKKRDKSVITCALVGYTNAGKSSILNALTGSDVLEEDKLFATLDPTTRILKRKGQSLVITDTVGFIRRLPHALIDAFRSTLEEAAQADVLVHVLDAADPDAEIYYHTTISVLQELGAGKKPVITALNKIDRIESPDKEACVATLQSRFPGSGGLQCIPVSAKTREGLDALVAAIDAAVAGEAAVFRFPPERSDLAAMLHREGQVLSENYEGTYIEVKALVDGAVADRLEKYVIA